MSGNETVTHKKVDRRIRRTRDRLGDALVALMHEKPFDSITVQQVLDRAHVSRSTFYQHYRDKDDLFVSDVEEFFEDVSTMLSRRKERSDRVAPVREFFSHVGQMRRFWAALVASGKIHDNLELGQGHFARGIERRFEEVPRGRAIPTDRRRALANALAGALLSLLKWWIDSDVPGSPAEMDELFHRMVWSGVPSPESSRGKR